MDNKDSIQQPVGVDSEGIMDNVDWEDELIKRGAFNAHFTAAHTLKLSSHPSSEASKNPRKTQSAPNHPHNAYSDQPSSSSTLKSALKSTLTSTSALKSTLTSTSKSGEIVKSLQLSVERLQRARAASLRALGQLRAQEDLVCEGLQGLQKEMDRAAHKMAVLQVKHYKNTI